jgi:hypothetical protein
MKTKTELKTLKDLNIIKGKIHALGGEVGIDELKSEAVKWVKSKEFCRKCEFCFGAIQWIRLFFNLTKEDLEEKE